MDQKQTTNSTMQVLEQLNHLPLQLDNSLYQHYPAMKLGQRSAITFYGVRLAALAVSIFRQSPHNNWAITAPPCQYLPAGANLLARKVHQLLAQQEITTELVEPKLNQRKASINNEAEFKRYHDYSKNNLQQRIAERQREQNALEADQFAKYFKNKSLIVINDINVTGTQQRFLQQAFDQLNIKTCYWLYIINIETSLANEHPEIEYQINNSQLQSMESFSEILADPQTQHTARCISRLFNEDFDKFYYLLSHLSFKKRQYLYDLSIKEGRYSGKMFEQKMQLLGSRSLPDYSSIKPTVSIKSTTSTAEA